MDDTTFPDGYVDKCRPTIRGKSGGVFVLESHSSRLEGYHVNPLTTGLFPSTNESQCLGLLSPVPEFG